MTKRLLGCLLWLALAATFSAGAATWKIPPGTTPDNTGFGGLYGLAQNVNLASPVMTAITTAGTNTTLTTAQLLSGMVKLNTGASGGFTITLPSTATIIAAMGNTVPLDGTFAMILRIENNNTAQTGTVTAGDGSTTLTGTMTIATNTTRTFLLTVTAATTITIENLGSMAL